MMDQSLQFHIIFNLIYIMLCLGKILKYQFPEQELMKFLQVTMIISCSFLNQLHKKRDKKLLNDNVKYWNKYILPNIRNPYLRKFNFYINNPNNRKNIYEEYFNLKKKFF